MKAFVFAVFLCFVANSAVADSLELRFEEYDFLKAYNHQTFIKGGIYVHAESHWDPNGSPFSTVPDLYTLKLEDSQQKDLINKLLEVGVADWEKEYSVFPTSCDGLSFLLRIKSERLDIFSTGACLFPPGYGEMVKILNAVHKPPNKPLNTDASDAGAG